MKSNKRLMTGFSLVAAAVLLLGSGLPALAQTGVPSSAKPDVHLTFDIHADGSNVMTLEIAVHPLIDPAVRQGLDWARQRMPKGLAISGVEVRDTTRESRKYAALVAQINSIGDLNALVNTPQLLSSVLKPIDASITLPNIFSWFEVTRESSGLQSTYKINASMDAATTRALSPVNLTIHFRLPLATQEHNADKVTGTELIWRAPTDKPLNITVTAAQRSLLPQPGGTGTGQSITRALPWVAGVVLGLGLLAAVVVLLLRWQAGRANKQNDDY